MVYPPDITILSLSSEILTKALLVGLCSYMASNKSSGISGKQVASWWACIKSHLCPNRNARSCEAHPTTTNYTAKKLSKWGSLIESLFLFNSETTTYCTVLHKNKLPNSIIRSLHGY